jgi:hypothetical protein
MKKSLLIAAAIAASVITAPIAQATTSYMVPSEIAPGMYRMTSSSPYGAYAEVCGDYSCTNLIQNFFVDQGESTVVVVPPTAVMVNGDDAVFTRIG